MHIKDFNVSNFTKFSRILHVRSKYQAQRSLTFLCDNALWNKKDYPSFLFHSAYRSEIFNLKRFNFFAFLSIRSITLCVIFCLRNLKFQRKKLITRIYWNVRSKLFWNAHYLFWTLYCFQTHHICQNMEHWQKRNN